MKHTRTTRDTLKHEQQILRN